jgi:hypothetical protein
MAKMLLTESFTVRPRGPLSESVSGPGYIAESVGGVLKVKLPVTVLNTKNENGRTYKTGIMEGAIRNAKGAMERRELLSSVNEHPESPYVTPGEASHVVTEAWVEGDHLWNSWDILETTNGNNLRALIKAEVAIGVSIRGLGSQDNYGYILDDYEYLGTDCVGQPSANIRPKPEVVESIRNKDETKEEKMIINDIKKYVREQVVLMKADPDRISAFKRASDLEEALAEFKGPARELVEAFNAWEAEKPSIIGNLTEATKPEVDLKAKLEETVANNNRSAKLFRKVMEDSSREYKNLEAKFEALTMALKAEKDRSKTLSESLTESRNKYKVAVSIAARERKSFKEATQRLNESGIAVIRGRMKYRLAIKEAASLLKSRAAIKESYNALVQMTGKALKEGKITLESLQESTKGSDKKMVRVIESAPEVKDKITEANNRLEKKNGVAFSRGEHSIPGWL